MKQLTFKPYSDEYLPYGFKLPQEYLALSKDMSYLQNIQYFSWWFVDGSESNNSLQEDIDIYYRLTGHSNLLVFARDGDWAACFDLNDHSKNPQVWVYDLGNRENYGKYINFSEWLNSVVQECKD